MYVDIQTAAKLLLSSHVVAIPTETVWGLAACACDQNGIQEIFRLKKRPQNNPLIIHIDSLTTIFEAITIPAHTIEPLVHLFWPGSLTLVVPVYEESVLPTVRAGLSSAAFRMPKHEKTLKLIKETGPLVAPSANLSTRPSATIPRHIEDDFGKDFPILYCDKRPQGIESTILIFENEKWSVGRFGAISLEEIAPVLGYTPSFSQKKSDQPLCPGQMYRHYAPKAHLHLATTPWSENIQEPYDCVLGFSDRIYKNAPHFLSLGKSTHPVEIAQNLFHCLRSLDYEGYTNVFVDFMIENSPAFFAIKDRLTKAST